MEKYYLKNQEDVLKDVCSTELGLTGKEAAERLEKNGKNKLKEAEKESLFKKFINSISDPMIIMLIAAAAARRLTRVSLKELLFVMTVIIRSIRRSVRASLRL